MTGTDNNSAWREKTFQVRRCSSIVLSELKFKSQLDVRVDIFNIPLVQIAHYLRQKLWGMNGIQKKLF